MSETQPRAIDSCRIERAVTEDRDDRDSERWHRDQGELTQRVAIRTTTLSKNESPGTPSDAR